MIESILRDPSRSNTRNPWQQYATLYDPDRQPEADAIPDMSPAVGAIPMEIMKADFPAYRKKLLTRNPHCFYCGERVGRKTSSLDHVVPQSRGGRHSPGNLVLTCLDCNHDKDADTPAEWLARNRAELQRLRVRVHRLKAAIAQNDLADLRALPRPEKSEPLPTIEFEGVEPTVDRAAFDLSRPMFSIVRTVDKKRLVSRLRGTDVAHYLESAGADPSHETAILCEQFWHPKRASSTEEGSEAP